MNITVHIEQMIVDGALLPSGDLDGLRNGIAAELGLLLGGRTVADRPAPPAGIADVSRQAASAAYEAINGWIPGGRHG